MEIIADLGILFCFNIFTKVNKVSNLFFIASLTEAP